MLSYVLKYVNITVTQPNTSHTKKPNYNITVFFIYIPTITENSNNLSNPHKLNTNKINHKQLFNNLLSYTSELTTSILSLQKVNYISLHLASAVG